MKTRLIQIEPVKEPLINVLDHGYVRYVEHLGTDQRIVEAARVSYGAPSKGEEADKKLLGYLYKNRHTSPFEQCSITFNIKMPIFVMRQFVRHRTFRLNEVSARYTELPDEFYLPEEWRGQDMKNKQGSVKWDQNQQICSIMADYAYGVAYDEYQKLIAEGVARELARIVLPVAIYTEIYVNCDLHNLMHFLRLRLDPHAQLEIRVFAEAMKSIATELFPWTMEAFDRYKTKVVDRDEDLTNHQKT